jgi:protein-tyrosine-phosphatase
MAEALLRSRLGEQPGIDVASAGFLEGGAPCPRDVLAVMDEVGLDLSGHRSRQIHADLVDAATLVVTMSRQHAIDLAVGFPAAWSRCFTVSELEQRASAAGGPLPGETLEAWVARLNGGRQRSDLLRLPSSGDIPDPIGKSLRDFRQTRDRLREFAGWLSPLVVQGGGSPVP